MCDDARRCTQRGFIPNEIKLYVLTIVFLSFLGCSLMYPTKKPIDTIQYMTGKERAENLIVMLPGRMDDSADYMKHGFITALQNCGIHIDAIAVDAHYGYYNERNLLPRLYEDVILPARQKGYKNVWLLGISMGGLGALLYAQQYAHTVNGLVVLAPFLGDREVCDEISGAGGLAQWSPQEPITDEDYQRALWKWLKNYISPQEHLPVLVMGYGKDDRFADANRLLAEILPKDQVYVVPGGHEWASWGKIYTLFLQSGVITHGISNR